MTFQKDELYVDKLFKCCVFKLSHKKIMQENYKSYILIGKGIHWIQVLKSNIVQFSNNAKARTHFCLKGPPPFLHEKERFAFLFQVIFLNLDLKLHIDEYAPFLLMEPMLVVAATYFCTDQKQGNCWLLILKYSYHEEISVSINKWFG